METVQNIDSIYMCHYRYLWIFCKYIDERQHPLSFTWIKTILQYFAIKNKQHQHNWLRPEWVIPKSFLSSSSLNYWAALNTICISPKKSVETVWHQHYACFFMCIWYQCLSDAALYHGSSKINSQRTGYSCTLECLTIITAGNNHANDHLHKRPPRPLRKS